MRLVVFDTETDGLLDKLTRIHSLVLRDLKTDEVVSCTDSAPDEWYTGSKPGYLRAPLSVGYTLLRRAERLYAHNGIKFDFWALRKVLGADPFERAKLRDTLTIAQMRWAHIREEDYQDARKGKFPSHLAGLHTLEAWGVRLGMLKGNFGKDAKGKKTEDAFAVWTPEMQAYCEQDTAVGRALVQKIRKTKGISAEAMEVEHELAWYLAQQERNGWPFDQNGAIALAAKLAARRQQLSEDLIRTVGKVVKKDGPVAAPKRDSPTRGLVAGALRQKIKLEDFNPGSRQQIARLLTQKYGWEPTEFTKTGQVKIDESSLKGLDTSIPEVALLTEYLLVEKRLGQISEGDEAWLRHATKDGPEGGKLTGLFHIHHRVKQNHAITHRASHSGPNAAQVPKVGSPYGGECRALWMVPPGPPEDPEGWAQIGADAASLEARCLAHYLAPYPGGKEYGHEVVAGDVHTANMGALGLKWADDHDKKRKRSGTKNWYYAFMYGGGDSKLGKMLFEMFVYAEVEARYRKLKKVPPSTAVPREVVYKWFGGLKKKRFLENLPALNALIADTKARAREFGYLDLIDGRRTYIRSDHAALNTLLQSAGALICKRWIVNFNRRLVAELGPQGWRGQWVALGWIHDEVQLAVRRKHAQRVCEILVEEMRKLTQHFRWNVPLDGEAKIGLNWMETH